MKPPIEPVVWTPPPWSARVRHGTGARPFPPLRRISLPALGEDVAVDAQGRLLAGLVDGRVVRVTPGDHPGADAVETLVETGGRPCGIEVAPDGSLIVCDARRGVLRVDPEQRLVEVLVDAVARDLRLCNNGAVAADGTIYFSDSSRHFDVDHWRGELLEHSGTGRLLRRTPDGKVEVLLDGLEFANGVALAPDESFVAVAETGAYRVVRLWLRGERAGDSEIFVDDLPGFPDNLATAADGLVWVAVASSRNRALDFLHRSHPLLRRALWALPQGLQPRPARELCVLAIDPAGRVVHDFAGASREFHMITGVRAAGGRLYLASIEEPALAVASL